MVGLSSVWIRWGHHYSVINDSEDLHRKMRQKPKRGVADVVGIFQIKFG